VQVKFSPQQSDYAWAGSVINDNVAEVNGVQYAFPTNIILYDPQGPILEAHRDTAGELYITVLRSYRNGESLTWDTGEYQ